MIVVHALMRSKPERRAETVETLLAMQRATREFDQGCLHYAFVADLEDDCVFTCVEEWADMAALRAHLASPHLAELGAKLSETREGQSELRIFEATRTELS